MLRSIYRSNFDMGERVGLRVGLLGKHLLLGSCAVIEGWGVNPQTPPPHFEHWPSVLGKKSHRTAAPPPPPSVS